MHEAQNGTSIALYGPGLRPKFLDKSDIMSHDAPEHLHRSCIRFMVKQNINTATDENSSIKTVGCSADTHLLSYTWLNPELGFYIMLHGFPFHDEVYVNMR